MASGDILLSTGVRNNLLALQSTADLISRTQTRLATGKRVNSALDDAFSFFTSAAFQTRASDLSFLLSGMDIAIKTLEAADKGISTIKTLVENAEASARQALTSERTTAGVNTTVGNLVGTSTFAIASGMTLTIGDGTVSFSFNNGASTFMTVQTIIDGVNNTANLRIKASLNDAGQILLEATGTNQVHWTGTATTGTTSTFQSLGLGPTSVAGGTLNSTRSSLAAQFDAIRTQINGLSTDSGFNGVSLLNSQSLKVVFNEEATTSLTLSGVNATATGIGISATTNTWQTSFDIKASITLADNAATTLKNFATTYSNNNQIVLARQDFTKSLIKSLESGAEQLVLADTNEEGANLLALQTRQQLSSTALALSAQNDQAILRLFG